MDYVKDECCICYEKNLALGKGGKSNGIRKTCCGALICESCDLKIKEALKPSKDVPELTCPMCRSLIKVSYKENFDRCLNHAKEGRAWAMVMVGQYYREGKGVAQSFKKAFEYCMMAAELGDAHAQHSIGAMYAYGVGVEKCLEKSFHFFMLAASQSHPSAQCKVGNLYYKGEGVSQSLDKAIEWWSKAAENGDADAQYFLGRLYYTGEGVKQNYEKAFEYYSLAAKEDHNVAQFNLALLYEKGEGVGVNYVKAIYWFRQSMKDNKNEEKCKEVETYIKQTRESLSKYCYSCKKEGEGMKQCDRCFAAHYCSRECQIKDWKEGGHKDHCKKV